MHPTIGTTQAVGLSAAGLHRLAHLVAPDLKSHPLYLLCSDDLPPGWRLAPDLFGFTSARLDLAFRSHLEATGRWQGRGRVVALNTEGIQAVHGRAADPFVLGTLLHEIAHALEVPDAALAVDDLPPDIQQHLAACARQVVTGPAPAGRPEHPDWVEHHGPWLRNCLHLVHRLEIETGVTIQPRNWMAYYGLSGAVEYQQALGDEPQRLAGLPLADIHATPPPCGFARLWFDDVRKWYITQADCAKASGLVVWALNLFHLEGQNDDCTNPGRIVRTGPAARRATSRP